MLEFDQELDYNADIDTYRRSRQRLVDLDTAGWSAEDKGHVNAMIRDCDYAIEWLETGRRPGNKRGVERLAAYQREIPIDLMDKYAQPAKPLELMTDERMVEDLLFMGIILNKLTDRERQCFEMHIGGMYSIREIAQELQIRASSVQEFIARANKKIRRYRTQPVALTLDFVV